MSQREPPTTIFFHPFYNGGTQPHLYARVHSPLVEQSTYWCHVSFPLRMGVLIISEEKGMEVGRNKEG